MNEQLNSAQVQAAQKMAAYYIEGLQLRKWAMEQALTKIGSESNLVQLAQQIYDFVVPVSKVEIDPNRPF